MRMLGRILLRALAAIAVLLVIAALAGIAVVRSGWFHEYVRRNIIAQIEKATGGRAELGGFSFNAGTLTAQVAPLILHGKEGPEEPPLLRVDSVKLGLRIISLIEHKVDLSSARIVRPQFRIAFYADGTNNLPSPRVRANGKSWSQELLNVAIRQYEISDGLVEYDDRKIPLNLRGDGLEVQMSYDRRTPAYRGALVTRHVRVLPGGLAPVEVGVSSTFTLDASRVVFSIVHVSTKESHADLTGSLEDLRMPHGTFTLKASSAMRELVNLFPIPLQPAGSGVFDGRLSIKFGKPFGLTITGRANGRGISYARDRVQIDNADVVADVNLGLDNLTANGVHVHALGGDFNGSAALAHWRQFHLEGVVDGLTVADAAKTVTDRPMPWNGTLAGTLALDTTINVDDTRLQTNLAISPASQGVPIQGRVDAAYDQTANKISLGTSYIATPATRVDMAGTLGSRLQMQFRSTNLDDLLPALAIVEMPAPKDIPLKLKDGIAAATGVILGTLDHPRFQGQVSVNNGVVNGHAFDHFTADLDATREAIAASRFALSRGVTEASGSASIAVRAGSFDDASVTAQMNLRNANLEELAKEAGSSVAVQGVGSATVRLAGTVVQPQADIALDVQKPAAFGEQLDRVRANLRIAPGRLEVSSGNAEEGSGRIQFSGSYQHGTNWKSGDIQVQAVVQNLQAARAKAVAALQPPVDGRISGSIRAQGRVTNGEFALTSVSGNAMAQAITVNRQPVGEVTLLAETRGHDIAVTAKGKLQQTPFEGQGSWSLQGDAPGNATVQFSRMTIASVHRLMMLTGTPAEQESELPFEGYVEGRAAVSLPLHHPRDYKVDLTLDTVQVSAKSTQAVQLGMQQQDLVLRNSQPVVVSINPQEAVIRAAHFTGRDTNIEATGTVPLATPTGANVSLDGTVNLAVLQMIYPDLLAHGSATVQASVRGALRDPVLSGRMELKGASVYINDIPTGLDNANGAIVFDRNRATIDKLTAEIGGGKVSFGGFVEFGAPLTYRLQADLQQVRMRLPNELSITSNATLALNGTSDTSTVSGAITLARASFTPSTDFFQLMASSAKPVPVPAPGEYLRGMQFDVRVESAPNFELQTTLTRELESDVNLTLRGSVVRPVLLGTVSVNQGEIQVLGNRYTIDRGDIRFLNPGTIEPTLDMNLATRARGVTVNITLSGTMDKLKVNYSSDPPLQTSEIIALLAVGRAPSPNAGLASAQYSTSSSSFLEAGGGLLSEALSAQLSSKVQRFLGSSRVKIDPTMTGLANTPQAMLTFEQQVSQDITLTYITNLNYTAEQIVRFEWNLNRRWSAIAVRDSNGLFGIDFQYRKTFK